MVATTESACAEKSPTSPNASPFQRMAGFTSLQAKMPVQSAPKMPPTPWQPKASRASS